PDLAAVLKLEQLALLPVGGGAAVGAKAGELEGLAVELLHRGELHTELGATRPRPGGFAVDGDHLRAGARLIVVPEHLEPPLRIAGEQDRGHELRTVGTFDLRIRDVVGAEYLREPDMA